MILPQNRWLPQSRVLRAQVMLCANRVAGFGIGLAVAR